MYQIDSKSFVDSLSLSIVNYCLLNICIISVSSHVCIAYPFSFYEQIPRIIKIHTRLLITTSGIFELKLTLRFILSVIKLTNDILGSIL